MSRLGTRFLKDGAVTDVKVSNGISKGKVGLDQVDNTSDLNKPVSTAQQTALDGKADSSHSHVISDTTGLQTALDGKSNVGHGHAISDVTGLQTALDAKIASTEKGANNGVATLDAGGKVPVSQLPNSVMEFKGVFDPASATFTDASGNAGDVYLANASGTYDAGSGNITYAIGDWAVHNGTQFEKSLNSNSVVSVNGQQGVVTLDADDISDAATTNKFASQAQLDKVDFLTVTQAVDLDAMETASHSHSNKALLDTYTQTEADIASAVSQKHGHTNKALLDTYNQTEVDLADAVAQKHSHANKALLDTYTQTEADIADAVSKKHAHANSAVLAAITDAGSGAIITTAERNKLAGIEAGATADQLASEVPYTQGTNTYVTGANVQAGLDSVESQLQNIYPNIAVPTIDYVTLTATDITNNYITLTATPFNDSVLLSVEGVIQTPGVDYDIVGDKLYFGDVSPVSLPDSDLDPADPSGLISGDKLFVKYAYSMV